MYSAASSHSSMVAAKPRLSRTGRLRLADGAQQREVLHVAAADLQDIGVLGDGLDQPWLHHFGDDRQAVSTRRPAPAACRPGRPSPWKL